MAPSASPSPPLPAQGAQHVLPTDQPMPAGSRPGVFLSDRHTSSEMAPQETHFTTPAPQPDAHTPQLRASHSVASSEIGDLPTMTIKDRQDAINIVHPFGLKLWKPALYKKVRTVTITAEESIRQGEALEPDGRGSKKARSIGNIVWSLLFGWVLASVYVICGSLVFICTLGSGSEYTRVVFNMAGYVFWPFGKVVERRERDDGHWVVFEGSEAEVRPNSAGLAHEESRPLLTSIASTSGFPESQIPSWSRPMASQNRSLSKVIFRAWFLILVAPIQLFLSGLCWFLVISLPMSKVLWILMKSLLRNPLSLRAWNSRRLLQAPTARRPQQHSVVLCVFQAVGTEYLKYTVDGVNILFVNLLAIVVFTVLDDFIFQRLFGQVFWTSTALIFFLGLLSTIPLSFFIGMAVASISSQASLGLGAVLNATFGSIVEILLFAFMIIRGKSSMVYGSMIGNILAALLFIPGMAMLFGGLKIKEQNFNAKSAGVTATMLIFALIGVFAPTLYDSVYGTSKLVCTDPNHCSFLPTHPLFDPHFNKQVEPLMIFCITILPTAYCIGLLFTLKTHVESVYDQFEARREEFTIQQPKYPPHSVVGTPQIRPLGLPVCGADSAANAATSSMRHGAPEGIAMPEEIDEGRELDVPFNSSRRPQSPHQAVKRPSSPATGLRRIAREVRQKPQLIHVHRLANTSFFQSSHLDQINATTPATVSGYVDVSSHGTKAAESFNSHMSQAVTRENGPFTPTEVGRNSGPGAHDAPEWSRTKSMIILLSCTVLFAMIAEILVGSVTELGSDEEGAESDSLLSTKEKFLGVTLFALVPSTTEIVNAVSFALQGNIALSLEIGSAYALQVCLIQVPFVALFSYVFNFSRPPSIDHTFLLLFPQWDVIATFLSVFLITYVYIEGKSDYFKGSILLCSYAVLLVSYWFVPRDHYAPPPNVPTTTP